MTHVSGCQRCFPKEQPLAIVHCVKEDGVTQKQTVPGYISSLPASCFEMLLKCVQSVSLCHYQIGHTYFTGEMKVFLLLVTSVPSRWPQRHSPRRAIITTLYAHAHHVITCLCVCAPACVCMWRTRHEFVCLSACIWQNMCVQTYGLTSMQTLLRPVRRDQCPGSKCQTQLT